ncbi:uncharacterized protein LOC119672504 [Teleopsis dalmanni]|uniref:uncharacterized protein LOC119672504 n=1 Tax=Teleopsis dalmanni TaxID=139649 RepID=UPI0018CEB8DB|nr:uncharacterized protein LOC119670289 isoform X1 [Teleopsis dalmanni]XP_037939492.1 uncharacterized protein LOC119672504 [Teleopsis dalmanni]
MDAFYKYRYSIIAGTFAAGGSFFGKLPTFLVEKQYLSHLPLNNSAYATSLEYVFRVLPILLMILCNVMNWRYFLKALQTAEQTIFVTVLTTATNYIVSFVLASFIYQEVITFLSTIGTTFIIGGLWFLCSSQEINKKSK